MVESFRPAYNPASRRDCHHEGLDMSVISRHESLPGAYTLRTELWLPREIREVFDFFADAHRLEEITPPWLHFHVLTPKPVPMFAGT
ncbi:MAG: hypothetical protein H7062_26160, partial [Candidatus Saccharimonas sp.]|nr:hypothetical protein [Planctomycetaceae bacterium]